MMPPRNTFRCLHSWRCRTEEFNSTAVQPCNLYDMHSIVWPMAPFSTAFWPSFSLLHLLSAAGLFTWPRVTDSQPHVWPLETDKASLHPPNWRLYHSPLCVWACECVRGRECVVITPGPSTRLRLAFSVYNGLDQSRLSVQPVSGPAVWSHINYSQAPRMYVWVIVCFPSQ